jgi:hypothetical protein
MGKRGANHPGFFKVQGGAVEDRDKAARSKQALDREAASLKRRAGARKPAPAARRVRKPTVAKAPPTEPPEVLAREHDRAFARMNERRPAPKRVKRAAVQVRREDYPSYLGATARGVIRRAMRVALTPFALARAVVDRFRERARD